MVRLHHDHICNVYTLGTTVSKGSSIQTKTILYTSAKCDYWKRRSSYAQTPLAVQTNDNSYEMNFSNEYPGIAQGHIVLLYGVEYKVDDVIPHHRHGVIDNYQVYVSKTTT